MAIRTYRPGDEVAQVGIYNEVAGELPKFKPATVDEVRRRYAAGDFDPTTRLYAEVDGRVVGYVAFHRNGRVSYPWCRKGQESLAEPLFDAVLQAMQAHGLRRAFAAYRGDWPTVEEFFTAHGFRLAREMVNFVVDLVDLPTPAAVAVSSFRPLTPKDVPAVLNLAPPALRVNRAEELERHLLHNAYFPPEAVYVLHGRSSGTLLAVGVLVEKAGYANPKQLDAAMPCFRLGAFGTEGMAVKRINGLFSFLVGGGNDANPLALSLLNEAAHRLRDADIDALAAQAPSDVPHLLRFYQQYFRRQGSFPVFERELV